MRWPDWGPPITRIKERDPPTFSKNMSMLVKKKKKDWRGGRDSSFIFCALKILLYSIKKSLKQQHWNTLAWLIIINECLKRLFDDRRQIASPDRSLTFLNIMSEHTDRAVKRAAISSMMMPTGILVFKPVRAAIQPLARQRTEAKWVRLQDTLAGRGAECVKA